MVNDGILEGIYKLTEDNTFDDVKTFSSFLYCIFFNGKYNHYEIILPKSKQPGQLNGSSKTHKFNCIEDITLKNRLKFRLIIAQSGIYTYNISQVTPHYLKP